MKNKKIIFLIISLLLITAIIIFVLRTSDEKQQICPNGQKEVCGYIANEEEICGCRNESEPDIFYKPIIYLYPQEETEISVKVSNPEKFIVTYPLYKKGWSGKAFPDGTIIINDKRYYGLYWEGYNRPNFSDYFGFVVEKNDVADFLDEKLTILGLNWKERNEFIIYWLPQLINNEYTFITFAEQNDIDEYMSLEITPQPETLIRVFMFAKEVGKDYSFEEQKLEQVERSGYTIVEWGGSIQK